MKCLAQEHNTMSPARARIRTARSRVERTNHKGILPKFHFNSPVKYQDDLQNTQSMCNPEKIRVNIFTQKATPCPSPSFHVLIIC